jgi:hypothetical protein
MGRKNFTQCTLRYRCTQHRESNVSKAYPSNLSRYQYERLSDVIPEAKPSPTLFSQN